MTSAGGISSALYFCLPTVKSGFSLVFLSLSSMMSRGLAASRQPSLDDQVHVVLHGLGPVVHQVLIDVVGVEQRGLLEGGEQVLGERLDQRLGLVALGDAFEARRVGRLPLREQLGDGCVEGGELGVAEDGGLDLGRRRP